IGCLIWFGLGAASAIGVASSGRRRAISQGAHSPAQPGAGDGGILSGAGSFPRGGMSHATVLNVEGRNNIRVYSAAPIERRNRAHDLYNPPPRSNAFCRISKLAPQGTDECSPRRIMSQGQATIISAWSCSVKMRETYAVLAVMAKHKPK